jgi:hypothetical protein
MKKQDLTGKQFGELIAIKEIDKKGKGNQHYYQCLCSCGTTKDIRADHLRKGLITTCGCRKGRKISNSKLHSIIGNRYGKLTVVELIEVKKINNKNMFFYNCICDCGNTVVVPKYALKYKHTQSCGCLRKEQENVKNGNTCLGVLFSQYKSRAKKFNRIFELSLQEFKVLTSSNCFYCGSPPEQYQAAVQQEHHTPYKYNGVDRLDNDKGYTKENSVPCCRYCNSAKSNRTLQEFTAWIAKLCNKFTSPYG